MYKIGPISPKYLLLSISILIISFLIGCGGISENSNKGKVVAEVYGKLLYDSDINNSVFEKTNNKDSLLLKHSIIEHWVRKTLLAYHADTYIKDKEKINHLVEDYKNSLLIELFEKEYIENNLDTAISEKDLKEFYEENKNNFKLDHSVINLLYVKIDEKKPKLDKFYENWNKDRYKSVISYGKLNSNDYYLDYNKWYNLIEIQGKIPKFLQKKGKKFTVQKNRNGFEYFLKVLDTKYKNEIVPLEIVKDKVKKLIVRKRKSEIFDNYIEDLYKKEVGNKNVKIFD